MDQPRTNRAADDGQRPGRLLSILAAGGLATSLAAGCAGVSLPGGGPPGGPLFSGDPCALLTTSELETAIGGGNVSGSPEPAHESSSDFGCSWTLAAPGDPIGDSVNLTITSPGGAADFASTRQFLEQLQGSPDPSATGAGSAARSPADSSEPDGDLGISLQAVPGLGDDAFVGAAGTVYTIKGDIELELQLIAFDDPKAQQDTIDLLRKALARLP
jgi:hypothetical protein